MTKPRTYPNWSSPSKILAREQTVIEVYRYLSGRDSIPDGKQYWTMCGQNANEDGTIRSGCEFEHVVSSGLVHPSQFFGVELVPEIHELNCSMKCEASWIHGDLYDVMVERDNIDKLSPAIVNVDHVKMPHSGGSRYVLRVMALLSEIPGPCMVTANLVLRYRSHKKSYQDYISCLSRDSMSYVLGSWEVGDMMYVYSGACGRTEMGTMIFWKDK